MPLATAATGATAALKAAKLVVAPPTATKPLHLVEKADAAEKPEAAGAAAPARRKESAGREGDTHTHTYAHMSMAAAMAATDVHTVPHCIRLLFALTYAGRGSDCGWPSSNGEHHACQLSMPLLPTAVSCGAHG
jgi:hypothetical protein